MDCVKTVAGKQHSAVSYSYKGWRLTKSVSLSDTKGVIIALECTKKRSLHCKYKLTVKGDPDAVRIRLFLPLTGQLNFNCCTGFGTVC